jgi:hypothetical protein
MMRGRRPGDRGPEETALERAALKEAQRKLAREMQAALRHRRRLPSEDRPRLARSLGRMVETAWPGEERRRAAEIFAQAYPGSEASLVKKRSRYMRFKGEPLPEGAVNPGEYAAGGATFAQLAEAFAALRYGKADEDKKLMAILNLLEGTSLDQRQAHLARDDVEARQALGDVFARIRDEVLRDADLVGLFSLAVRYPIGTHCDLAEAYALASSNEQHKLLEDDLRRLGLDPAVVEGMEAGARRQVLQGKTVWRRYGFMASLDPCRLAIEPDVWRLDPSAWVAGTPLDFDSLHWVFPRLRIGEIYLPAVDPCVDLDIAPTAIDTGDERATAKLIQTARDAALGWATIDGSGPTDHQLRELWEAGAEGGTGPVREKVFWERLPLYLAIVPVEAADNPTVCLWTQRVGFGEELVYEIGESAACDKLLSFAEIDGELCGLTFDARTTFLFKRTPFYGEGHPYWFTLLTPSDPRGLDILLGEGAQLVGRINQKQITPHDIWNGRVHALVRLNFVDPVQHYTPLSHDTVGAAIARNVLHAPPEQNLSRLLAVQAREYAPLVPTFITEQRQLFEQVWQDREAMGKEEITSQL